ncbi:MAG TPA: DUF916 domain-containing protein [Aeromicrobium sp.]|nr:DUF916 domain-containing protein [Aeromicrobium sp.]
MTHHAPRTKLEQAAIGRRAVTPSLMAALAVLASFVMAGAVFAQDGGVHLALKPVNTAGEFFDLTMTPGETRTLEVELTNAGDVAIAARTYAADVYTIINGGFGARLRDEAPTGTTTWLDYPAGVLTLAPGERIRRSFTLTVPEDAETGEYITSLVLENDEALRGEGEVALDQIVRQATAVVITVPGLRAPALEIGAASHTVVVHKSVVAVAVANIGNVKLKPVADFVLFDAAGAEVSRATIPMDSFYARSSTLVEVPLAALLNPGVYRIHLTLEAEGARAEDPTIPLIIGEQPVPGGPDQPSTDGLTAVIQSAQAEPAPFALGIGVAGLIVALIVAWLIIRRRRGVSTGQDSSGAS